VQISFAGGNAISGPFDPPDQGVQPDQRRVEFNRGAFRG
jgi:hypothetical protein